MSNLPITPLSPEEQQRLTGQIYVLMAKQIKSYHKHRHMGENSSVPLELAQELMESMEYTVNQAGGMLARPNVEESLKLGQAILEDKVRKAWAMLDLVSGTAPTWQTECRWEALGCLRSYLEQYDHHHLAHKGPDDLYYPILISPPEGIQGIDVCIFYLNTMWIENQIMAGVPDAALEQFWNQLPVDALNPCEHLLINGIGKALLGAGMDPPVFDTEEYRLLLISLMRATKENLEDAANQLCQWLNLKDENACRYVEAVIPQLAMWIGDNIRAENLGNIFI